MKDQEVTLTAQEVQYDLANKIGQKFGLIGIGTLCDYYNYGYDDSIAKYYYCVFITPPSGKYSESWHVYFERGFWQRAI